LNVVPIVQAYYAREQTDIARRQEIRDVARHEREEAERAKQPRLAVTLCGNTTAEFYPLGGHRDPRKSIQFEIYVENSGEAQAKDVVVRFGLPDWVHSVRYIVELNPDGTPHLDIRELGPHDLQFENGSPPEFGEGKCNEVASALVVRPVYPGQPWKLGMVAVSMPAGTFSFPWVIDSNAGRTTSDATTAISITVHDTAQLHDAVPWNALQDGTGSCTFCKTTRGMTPSQVFEYVQTRAELKTPGGAPST
jgi:hypothetical protein